MLIATTPETAIPNAIAAAGSTGRDVVQILAPTAAAALHADPPDGWRAGPVAGPWRTLTRHTAPAAAAVHLVDVLAAVADARAPLWAAPDDAAGHSVAPWLLPRLEQFRELTGIEYRGTPGVTGHAMIREIHAGTRGIRWHNPTPDGINDTAELDYTRPAWHRPADGPTFTLDQNMQYLAAAANVPLPTGPLRARGPADAALFADAARELPGGWWQITPGRWHWPEQLPDPAGPRSAAGMWVTTPTLDLLLQLAATIPGYDRPEFHRAYVDPATPKRILRGWAEVIRDAAARSEMEPVTATLKAVYRESVGMLGRPGGRIHRPDWRASIIGQARSNLWRTLRRVGTSTGAWPTAIHVDAVTYRLDAKLCGAAPTDADRAMVTAFAAQLLGLPVRPGLGGWKLKTA